MTPFVGSGLENYIKAWESGGLWKFETGQSTTVPSGYMSADGQYYIVYEDGSKGHNNIGYGLATFIEKSDGSVTHPIYGRGYYNWKDQFASHGVDVTTIKKIFDRYYTVENMKKYSGLGLTIAKQLVELNGGIITAKYIKDELYIEILF